MALRELTNLQKALEETGLGYVGQLGVPQDLHIVIQGDGRRILKYNIPSSSPDGHLSFEIDIGIDLEKVTILTEIGGVRVDANSV